MIVVDASIAFKWLIEEDRSDDANALAADSAVIAPTLLRAEVGNALLTKARRGDIGGTVAGIAHGLLGSFVHEWVELDALADDAFAIALEIGHPIYDCYYLALAEQRRAPLVTADFRFIERCRDTRFGRLIADW